MTKLLENPVVNTIVFADGLNGGNPCPVVLDADNLSATEAMSLAEKFGAETIIVVKPNSKTADFRLRYFVPNHEMEMCVHGTIAATTVLWQSGKIYNSQIKIETALGIIEVDCEEIAGKLNVTVHQFSAQFAKLAPSIDEICSALNISPQSIDATIGPIVSVSTSRHKLIVPIKSNLILNSLKPDFELLWNLCDRYETTGFYPFSRANSGEDGIYYARQFPRRAGYNEDPATGVAACALGAYLANYHHKSPGWQSFTILQGQAMGRPSRLKVGIYMREGIVTNTYVSGYANVDSSPAGRL